MPKSLAEELYDLLAAKAHFKGERLTKAEWLEVASPFLKQKKAVAAQNRNELFDAFAAATGTIDLAQLTRPMKSAIAIALNAIREVCPNVTPEEISARARRYRSKYPTWPLTAPSLAKHWSSLATPGSITSALDEPTGWREVHAQILPEDDYGATGAYLSAQPWECIPAHLQATIVRRLGEVRSKVVPFDASATG